MADFEKAIVFTLAAEGDRYTNIPGDAGGPTKYGITLNTLRSYYARINKAGPVTAATVEALSQKEAKSIYKLLYWDVYTLDRVTSQDLAQFIFDYGVNRGTGTAGILVQRTLNSRFNAKLTVDGEVGEKTITVLNGLSEGDSQRLVRQMIYSAQDAYVSIVVHNTSQLKFLAGWINRTQDMLEKILA